MSSKTNQTRRVLELLKRFNDNKKVCISALQNEYLWEGKSEKTIRRDLDVIKEVFPESFELILGEKGCYKAVTKKSFENFLTPQNISLLVQTFNLTQQSDSFKSFDIDRSDKAIIEKKIKEFQKIYEFKNRPFENSIKNRELFKQIEESIYQLKKSKIEYKTQKGIENTSIKPYKIIFINENFYLASENIDKDYIFSLYRISNIQKIEPTSETFHKNPDIVNFISDIQTPFATYQPNYKKSLIKAVLEVDASKARFFKSKKFLKSQEIKELENGNLLVTYTITQDLELEELIKKWLPHLKVIEPKSLKKKIEDELREYLSLTNPR